MKDIGEEKKIAILIDADNTQHSKLKPILQEIAANGHIITKRAYGDWSSDHLKNWKAELNANAIIPVQQFAYTQGKNSSDAAMIIDAMDLLYTKKYDAFALVSSDSDFTKLASRLRESQLFVFGVGKEQTPLAFVNACDDFIFIENLDKVEESDDSSREEEVAGSSAEKKKRTPLLRRDKQPRLDKREKELKKLLLTAYEKYSDEETGWANVSAAGSFLKRVDPSFDTRNYGYAKLSDLIDALPGVFEVNRLSAGEGSGSRRTIVVFRPVKK